MSAPTTHRSTAVDHESERGVDVRKWALIIIGPILLISLLRVITGADAVDFSEPALATFFEQVWRLDSQSDRMGARLQGEPVQAPARQWSLGVARGAIQVPPDGQPIILQADRQTMGGYPVLGWLHPLDQWRLAQCPAGQSLRFTQVSVSDAQAELREFYRFFKA